MSGRRETAIAIVAIAAVTVAAWSSALGGTFQFDDFDNIVRDPATTDAGALLDRLAYGLRPLTRISYFIDARLFGLEAWGYLATNVGLHVVTALLVFALARRRLAVSAACVAALVFALQPAHGEVIAYASGRSAGLAASLLLAGLLLHDRGSRVLALLLFTLACMAKETALVFPLLVLVWALSGGAPWRAALRTTAGYLVAAMALFALLLTFSHHRAVLAYSIELRSMPESLVANGHAAVVMLSLWLRPWALSVDHDFTPSLALGLLGLALLAGALAASLALRRRFPAAPLAIAWPIVALLPTSSIIAKLDLVTEKPLYLAWVGPSLAVALAFSALPRRRLVLAVMAGLLAALAVASGRRAHVWSQPIALWEDATAKAPGKSRCWNNLGMAYLSAGRDADAIVAFERAQLLDPDNVHAAQNLETVRFLAGGQD